MRKKLQILANYSLLEFIYTTKITWSII
jgi:hypothetical protein